VRQFFSQIWWSLEGGTSQKWAPQNETFKPAKHRKLKLTIQKVVCETIILTKFGSPPEGEGTPKMKLLNC